jgi:hypothetical protein
MPHRRAELAQYICEIGGDLIPLLKTHGLDATAHCLEMAVYSAATVVNQSGGSTEPPKPPLKLVRNIS